jgi:hypothetical protein
MKPIHLVSTLALLAAPLAPASFADGRTPGSVLVYTIHRSGPNLFTVVAVTNTNTQPQTPSSFGGSTIAHFEYVNVTPNPAESQLPLDCQIFNRYEFLTPADTLCVLTTCHNASGGQEGYLVVSAENPEEFQERWSFDYLIGSQLVVNAFGAMYSIEAVSFEAKTETGSETDKDYDDQIDFDGEEYEGVPEKLYIDSFIAAAGSSLTLLNLTGSLQHVVTVKFDIWNDNEYALSATKQFRCWFEEPLEEVALAFDDWFLRNNTPNDPSELDVNCDNVDDLETGWARIDGIVASCGGESIPNPALLGAITAGPFNSIEGGRLLWESEHKQHNGDFPKFFCDDLEFPANGPF